MYNVKYRLEYTSRGNYTTIIDILKKNYTGDIIELVGSANPVQYAYEASDEYQFATFKSSYIQLELKESLDLINDFKEIQDEDDFILKYYRNNVNLWNGYILAEQYSEGDDNNNPFLTLKFYDAISRLKVYNVNDLGLPFNQVYSLYSIYSNVNRLLYHNINNESDILFNDFLANTTDVDSNLLDLVHINRSSLFDSDDNPLSLYEFLERLASTFNFTYLLYIDRLLITNFEFNKNPKLVDFENDSESINVNQSFEIDENHRFINKSKFSTFWDSLKKMEVYHNFDTAPNYLDANKFDNIVKMNHYVFIQTPIEVINDEIYFYTIADMQGSRTSPRADRDYRDVYVENSIPFVISSNSNLFDYRLSFNVRFDIDYGISDEDFNLLPDNDKLILENKIKQVEENTDIRIYYNIRAINNGIEYNVNQGLNVPPTYITRPVNIEVNSSQGFDLLSVGTLIDGLDYSLDMPVLVGVNEFTLRFFHPYLVTNESALPSSNEIRIQGVKMIISKLDMVKIDNIGLEELRYEGVTNRNVFNYNLNRDKEFFYLNLEESNYKYSLLKSNGTPFMIKSFVRRKRDYSGLQLENLDIYDFLLTQSLEQLGFQQEYITGELKVYDNPEFNVLSSLNIDGKDYAIHKFNYNDKQGTYSIELIEIKQNVRRLKDYITGMCMLPSTGESVYSTTITTYTDDSDFSKFQNQNVDDSPNTSDFEIAVSNLKRDIPATKYVSLIVSWFGTDLRADFCKILPKAEHKEGESTPNDWIVSDYNRENGKVPSYFNTSFYNGSYYADSNVTLTPNFAEGLRGEMTAIRVQHVNTGFNKFATNFTVSTNTDYIIKYNVKALNTDNQTVWARVEGGNGFVELDQKIYTAKLDEWFTVELRFNSGIHSQIDLQMSIGDSWLTPPIVSDILIDIDSIFISEDNENTFEGLAYGGTPSDKSIIEGIQELKRQGYKVLFYPFILMDIKEGNGLPSPTGEFEQPIFPWRGRISVMPELDNTSFVNTAVSNFFGNCEVSDFEIVGDTVQYSGTPQDSYRKMILHYANLCVIAGGVDAFAVGTEMRGLTWLRSARTTFPAVTEFNKLLDDCRLIMGDSVELTYASDWTEVTPYQPQDGTGDLLHHLDSLWMNPNCDFIGIDNYIPLSDWRDGEHLDKDVWGSIYNVDYLKSQIEGGELYDYFYANDSDRENQIRTPIDDFNYRVKDNKNWWLNNHFNRLAFEFPGTQTSWIPQSKRIVYTEFGCSAIDKGTNEPNKFLDPKSSESTAPRYSNGERDDLIQEKYYEAFLEYWNASTNNPISSVYQNKMVDTNMMFAWTWDGRPYPTFPNKLEVWSDGVNYAKGHWLMGRNWIE